MRRTKIRLCPNLFPMFQHSTAFHAMRVTCKLLISNGSGHHEHRPSGLDPRNPRRQLGASNPLSAASTASFRTAVIRTFIDIDPRPGLRATPATR